MRAAATNRAMDRLRAGELSLGLSLRLGQAPNVAPIALACGYDWLFIDLEHGQMSFETASGLALSALECGITPLARVGGHEPFHANRVLTNGALGVFFPHVENAAQALACARASRFAPRGIRGVPAGFPHLGYRKPPLAQAVAQLNALTCVIAMIESREAVANADAIAATDGVDVLFVGASDLCVEIGCAGELRDPRVAAALAQVAQAARRHGKHAGLGGVGERETLASAVKQGYRMILAGNDLDLFMKAADAQVRELRALEG